jgi:hypothetical protein
MSIATPSGRSETGSIPLVLLAAIVLGGLIIALYTDVSTGQRLASADRDFHQAVQVADAGLQEAFTVLAGLDPADRPAVGDAYTGTTTGTLGRGDYEWTAVRVGTNLWQVRSVGGFGDHSRTLEASMGPLYLFGLAAFGDILIELRGANGADSYNATTTSGGQGKVGSNNQITLRGNATVDWVVRYGGAGYNNGGIIRTGGGIETGDEQELPDIGGDAYAPGGDCDPETAVVYSDITEAFPLQHGQTYCVAQARFPAGQHLLEGTRGSEPTRIFIAPSGNLELLGQGNNPCTGASCVNYSIGETKPDATALEIYLAGGGGEVLANNHSIIAAGIYAPLSNCSGPNAQGDIYGSIVCRTLDSKGGWQFHYDERFNDVAVEYFAITGVREEPGDTTSFATTP